MAEHVELPDGYYLEFGGQVEAAEDATRTIGLLSLVSLAAIFLLLFMEFGSTRQALLVMVNLPLALVGGVFAVLLTGGVLNIATLVGFITLFGIAVRNGCLLVSHYNHLLAAGVPLDETVWRGSMERLNPMLMTALAAGLALIPLALAGGEPGNEIQSPMAIVVLGGLLTAVVLNMIVVPALYQRYGVDRSPVRSRDAEDTDAALVLEGRETSAGHAHTPPTPSHAPLPARNGYRLIPARPRARASRFTPSLICRSSWAA